MCSLRRLRRKKVARQFCIHKVCWTSVRICRILSRPEITFWRLCVVYDSSLPSVIRENFEVASFAYSVLGEVDKFRL
jgi:hypothetical protein